MARENVKYLLRGVSDHEWTSLVPDDMIPVYLSLPDSYDDSFKRSWGIPQRFTDEELDRLKKLYPEWWVIEE